MRNMTYLVLSLALVSFSGCAEQAGDKKDDKKEDKDKKDGEDKKDDKKEE